MATLTPVSKSRAANPITFVAASGGGDKFANDGARQLIVRHTNGAGSSVTLTVTTPATTDGLAVADRAIVIAPGETHVLGPWPKSVYDDSNGDVALSWSATTDIDMAVIG